MKRYIMRRDLYYHMCYVCPHKILADAYTSGAMVTVHCNRKKCTEFYKLKG